MSSYIDQIRRMREARELDESPLVEALNRVAGVRAKVNDEGGAAGNRKDGDVWFIVGDQYGFNAENKFRVESQVSRKHTKFSYSYDKLDKYDGEWVYLACLERSGPRGPSEQVPPFGEGPMIHVAIRREELNEILREVERASADVNELPVKGVYLNEKDGRKFFTIYPTALANCESAVFGDTLISVVVGMVEQIRSNKNPQEE